MRKEWINEGKPKESFDSIETLSRKQTEADSVSRNKHSSIDGPELRTVTPTAPNDLEEDFYTATLRPGKISRSLERGQPTTEELFVSDDEHSDHHPSEDDLDALLAEDELKPAMSTAILPHGGNATRHDDFKDEMEAMAALDDMW